MLPIAPAVAAAVFDAVGVQMTSLPMSPPRVRQALAERGEADG